MDSKVRGSCRKCRSSGKGLARETQGIRYNSGLAEAAPCGAVGEITGSGFKFWLHFTCCVTWAKSLTLSVPHLHHS